MPFFGAKRGERGVLPRAAAHFSLLLTIGLLGLGSPVSRAEFELLKAKSKSRDAQAATAAHLREIDQATKCFADRHVTYLVDSCNKVEIDNPDPEARKQALRLKLFTSNPFTALLPVRIRSGSCSISALPSRCKKSVEEGRAKKILGTDHFAEVIRTINNAYAEV